MKYDYDIRATFDDIVGKDMFYSLDNTINDFDLIRLATELLRFERDRLDSDLNDGKILDEYNKINNIVKELEDIINNYV